VHSGSAALIGDRESYRLVPHLAASFNLVHAGGVVIDTGPTGTGARPRCMPL